MSNLKYSNETTLTQLMSIIKGELNKRTYRYAVMPLAGADYLNQIVLFDGTTTEYYTQGDWYRCISDGQEPATYSWVKTTYNREEIDTAIAAAGHFEAVAELPTTNIKTNTIYLVPKISTITGYSDGTTNADVYVSTGSVSVPKYDKYTYDDSATMLVYVFDSEITGATAEEIADAITEGTLTSGTFTAQKREDSNIKDEYINLDGTSAGWEKIGDTEIDLSNYVEFSDLEPISAAEVTALWNNTSPAV